MSKVASTIRYGEVERETRETRVRVVLDIDGGSNRDISTGIPIFDSMLRSMAFFGCFALGIQAEGDLNLDDHHTVEDVGICLGKAIRAALAESQPIERFGSAHGIKDDALVLAAIDVSGRGMLCYDASFQREAIGGLSTENIREFFNALAVNGGLTVHIRQITALNDHHLCEAILRGIGLSLGQACCHSEGRIGNSIKGSVD